MSAKSRIVLVPCPWYNSEEFDLVYKAIFSGNIVAMRWAIDRLTVWEQKSFPGLSIGYDATANIARAVVQDELHACHSTLCQPFDLRLMLAMSLIRFVNFISYITRNEGSNDLRTSARKAGLPEWLVHLRNDCCHSYFPPLSRLRSGIKLAMGWLKVNTWQTERASFIDYISTAAEKDCHAIMDFQSFRLRVCDGTETNVMSLMNPSLKPIRKSLKQRPDDFFKVLLQLGLFFPSTQDLMKILQKSNETSFMDEDKVELPLSLMSFWSPIITCIMENLRIEEFIEALFVCQRQDNVLIRKLSASWIFSIITFDKREGSAYSKIESSLWPSFNWARLMGYCVQSSCQFSPAILLYILSQIQPPLCDEMRNRMIGLVAVYLGAMPTTPTKPAKRIKLDDIHTVESIKNDLRMREDERLVQDIWHRQPDTVDISSQPLASAFGNHHLLTRHLLPDETHQEPVITEEVEEEISPIEAEDDPLVIDDLTLEVEDHVEGICVGHINRRIKSSGMSLYYSENNREVEVKEKD